MKKLVSNILIAVGFAIEILFLVLNAFDVVLWNQAIAFFAFSLIFLGSVLDSYNENFVVHNKKINIPLSYRIVSMIGCFICAIATLFTQGEWSVLIGIALIVAVVVRGASFGLINTKAELVSSTADSIYICGLSLLLVNELTNIFTLGINIYLMQMNILFLSVVILAELGLIVMRYDIYRGVGYVSKFTLIMFAVFLCIVYLTGETQGVSGLLNLQIPVLILALPKFIYINKNKKRT